MKKDFKHFDWEIIANILANEATPEEKQMFDKWISSNNENKSYFNDIKKIWYQSGTLSEYDLIDVNAARKKVKRKIKIQSNSKFHIASKLLKVAAIFVLAIGISWLTYFIFEKTSSKNIQYSESVTKNGEKAQVILSDGTKIWINSGSSLKYPDVFTGKKREVFLEGEAFFDVAHNIKSPFIVTTSLLQIEVLGTEFNISSYPDDETIETTLVAGTVKITSKNTKSKLVKENYILKPNEKATFSKNNNTIVVDEVITLYYTSWKDGRLFFNNETFENIAKKLERWYDLEIKLADSELKNNRYTCVVNNDKTIEHVLNLLDICTPIEYSIEGKAITIKQK
ncbi:MAG: FecR family protein [Bacteroidales bacterium]|nr:FecR family protein [Bacteroidales bacterium]